MRYLIYEDLCQYGFNASYTLISLKGIRQPGSNGPYWNWRAGVNYLLIDIPGFGSLWIHYEIKIYTRNYGLRVMLPGKPGDFAYDWIA